jgi:hypothetical protein
MSAESIHSIKEAQMLDLFVAADLVRQKTRESLADEAPTRPTRNRDQRWRKGLRFSSAAALRGLADRIEPSHTGAVSS